MSVQAMDESLKVEFEVKFSKVNRQINQSRKYTFELTWIDGLFRWPKLEVVCRGS